MKGNLNTDDLILKILVGLCLGGISFVGTFVMEMKASVSVIEARLEPVTEFAKSPRFTHQDYVLNTKPIDYRLTLVERELNSREDFMGEVEKRLRKIENSKGK